MIPSALFLFVGGKLECTGVHDLFEMVAECYAAKKGMTPPHFNQAAPSNEWPVPKHPRLDFRCSLVEERRLITRTAAGNRAYKHSTSAPLFKLPANFRILRWCRERSWGPAWSELSSSEKLLRSHVILVVFFVCKGCGIWFYSYYCAGWIWPQLSRFVCMSAVAFKCIFGPCDRESV